MKHDNRKKPQLKTEDMLALYKQGMSTEQIGKKFGILKSSVGKRLKKIGISLRTSSDYEGKNRYWLWKGADYIDPITRKRNQRKHRKWSKAVRDRDNNTCQDCGLTEVRLEAHHLIALKDCINSNLEFDINNGITVCSKCHKNRHKEQEA
jgi:hypothetical protein